MGVFPACVDHWPGLHMVNMLFGLGVIKCHEESSTLLEEAEIELAKDTLRQGGRFPGYDTNLTFTSPQKNNHGHRHNTRRPDSNSVFPREKRKEKWPLKRSSSLRSSPT